MVSHNVRPSGVVQVSPLSPTVDVVIAGFMKQQLVLVTGQDDWAPRRITLPSNDEKYEQIQNALQSLANSLSHDYGDHIMSMTKRLVSLSPIDYEAFKSIADDLFSGGIQMSHIITLLVFGVQLALVKGLEENEEDFTSDIVDWTIRYFNEVLKDWMVTSGEGWEGLISYSKNKPTKLDSFAGKTQLALGVGTIISLGVAGIAYFLSKS